MGALREVSDLTGVGWHAAGHQPSKSAEDRRLPRTVRTAQCQQFPRFRAQRDLMQDRLTAEGEAEPFKPRHAVSRRAMRTRNGAPSKAVKPPSGGEADT